MKKILVIYTGGTFGMQSSPDGLKTGKNILPLIQKSISRNFQTHSIPDFDFFLQKPIVDSSNITPKNWRALAQTIQEKYNKYDGFVILHGTDTMAYSCSMVSFMLRGLEKPVIYTGSQTPLDHSNTYALRNFIGALNAASNTDIKEVCLYFNNQLLRGNRCSKINTQSNHAFHSFNYPIIGYGCETIEINKKFLLESQPIVNFSTYCDIVPTIAILTLFPGMDADLITNMIENPFSKNKHINCNALILMTFGTGNGPTDNPKFTDVLTQACKKSIVINLSQCPIGTTKPDVYFSGSKLAEIGLLNGYNMTLEACFCKLHYLLSQDLNLADIKSQMQTNLCGEVDIS